MKCLLTSDNAIYHELVQAYNKWKWLEAGLVCLLPQTTATKGLFLWWTFATVSLFVALLLSHLLCCTDVIKQQMCDKTHEIATKSWCDSATKWARQISDSEILLQCRTICRPFCCSLVRFVELSCQDSDSANFLYQPP